MRTFTPCDLLERRSAALVTKRGEAPLPWLADLDRHLAGQSGARQHHLVAREKKRGLLAGARLPAPQAATIVKQIADRTPDQIKLPIVLWTREAVHDLIAQAQQARAT